MRFKRSATRLPIPLAEKEHFSLSTVSRTASFPFKSCRQILLAFRYSFLSSRILILSYPNKVKVNRLAELMPFIFNTLIARHLNPNRALPGGIACGEKRLFR